MGNKKKKNKKNNNNNRQPVSANGAPEPEGNPPEPAPDTAGEIGENGTVIPVCKASRV